MTGAIADLFGDADLAAYEATILTQFGRESWATKRAKACEDWLWPALRAKGFDLARWRSRYAPDLVHTYSPGVYTDVTDAATSTSTDDLDLATAFASGLHAICIGSVEPFRGLSIRIQDSPSTTAAVLTASAWCDTWEPLVVSDGTQATVGKPFSKGGTLTWAVPETWVPRTIDGSAALYWVKVALSAAPTGATAGQLAVIRRSVLAGPAALRTLALIFMESPTAQRAGTWEAKADLYMREAQHALERALSLVGGEFDTLTQDDVVDAEEAAQTPEQAAGRGLWQLERG